MQEVSQFSSQWSTLRLHSLLNAHETSDTTCAHDVLGNVGITIVLKRNERFFRGVIVAVQINARVFRLNLPTLFQLHRRE